MTGVVTCVIESQRATVTNMAARTYALASGLPGCDYMLLKILKLLPCITSVQYCGGSISTVEAVHYCEGTASVLWRNSISIAEG